MIGEHMKAHPVTIGDFQSSDRRVENTPEDITRLKKEAVFRLEHRLADYEPAHAALLLEQALAYLSKSQPTRSVLFAEYQLRLTALNKRLRPNGHNSIRPVSPRAFRQLSRFDPVLAHACRGTVAPTQEAARFRWSANVDDGGRA
jgi:hypothetical protein